MGDDLIQRKMIRPFDCNPTKKDGKHKRGDVGFKTT
jgi:hypothetical protein